MKRNVVAVSQRINIHPERNEYQDALDHRVITWLITGGYLPVPVPNVLSDILEQWLLTLDPSAIILSGGNNIEEMPERDHTENTLLAWAKSRQKPVLGICRGMQMMAVWAGAVLKPVEGHVGTRHNLQGSITGEVNSFHDFSIAECPPGFKILATAEDEEIEAIAHTALPWEGWMWHPERETCIEERDLIRLRRLTG